MSFCYFNVMDDKDIKNMEINKKDGKISVNVNKK